MYSIEWTHRRMFRKGEKCRKCRKYWNLRHFRKILRGDSALFYADLSTFCTMFLPKGRSFWRKAFSSKTVFFFSTSTVRVCVCRTYNIDWTHRRMFRKGEKCRKCRNLRHILGNPQGSFGAFLTLIFPLFVPCFRLSGEVILKECILFRLRPKTVIAPFNFYSVSYVQHRLD